MSPTESRIMTISVRGLIAFILAYTLCVITACSIDIPETFSNAIAMVLGFYFGQKGQGDKLQ